MKIGSHFHNSLCMGAEKEIDIAKREIIFEKLYIYKRNLKAFFNSIPYYLCHVFRVKPSKVVMWTFEGTGGYGDSPKYIAEEMLRRNQSRKEKFEIIWLAHSNSADMEFPEEIRVVKDSLLKKAYHLSTAAFWIGNTRTDYGTKKRRETVYIQTWHSIAGIKPIGKQRGNHLPRMAQIVSEYDSKMIDYVLSGNEWGNRMLPDGLFYYGTILQTGIPRCDILFHGKKYMHRKYREKYNLPQNVQILLYAPTFRGGSQKGKRNVNAHIGLLDFEGLITALENHFGGIWYMFFRLHPQVADQSSNILFEYRTNRVIDVSSYPDMNELIAACDMFLTDYSSSIFESAIMRQPGFLYVEDEEEYIRDRGELVFRFDEMPFPIAHNMNELISEIERFDMCEYHVLLNAFMENIGSFENGKSSKNVVDFIEKII